MRVVLQRVSRASVARQRRGGRRDWGGLLALVGVADGDGESEADRMAAKVAGLRIFADAKGRFNESVADVGGAVLVVSQFTLISDVRKGRRPSFTRAARPDVAERWWSVSRGSWRRVAWRWRGGSLGRRWRWSW